MARDSVLAPGEAMTEAEAAYRGGKRHEDQPTTRHTTRDACSFCWKGQNEVEHLIAGPAGASICDACVRLCQELLNEAREDAPAGEG